MILDSFDTNKLAEGKTNEDFLDTRQRAVKRQTSSANSDAETSKSPATKTEGGGEVGGDVGGGDDPKAKKRPRISPTSTNGGTQPRAASPSRVAMDVEARERQRDGVRGMGGAGEEGKGKGEGEGEAKGKEKGTAHGGESSRSIKAVGVDAGISQSASSTSSSSAASSSSAHQHPRFVSPGPEDRPSGYVGAPPLKKVKKGPIEIKPYHLWLQVR